MTDGPVEMRALFALYRNHPGTPPGEKWGPKAYRAARRQREMLLDWAATQPDETLLYCRNLGATSLRWIRSQRPALPTVGDDPRSPFEDLEDENADLRVALNAASEELVRLRPAAQAVVDGWNDYIEALAGRGHEGPHIADSALEGGCGPCAGARYGTEVAMSEYVVPVLLGALRRMR